MIDSAQVLYKLDIKKYFEAELGHVTWKSNGQGIALCPFHLDTKPSFSVDPIKGRFNCFGCNAHGNIFEFHKMKHSVDYKGALEGLAKIAGVTNTGKAQIDAIYDYQDENGNLIFQIVRLKPKSFFQQRPDGKGGWIKDTKGVKPIPYNLPEVVKAVKVFIAEGEKDVETLRQNGLVASCNPNGAGSWKPEYNNYFKDKEVIVMPDNDDVGKEHAENVAKNLKGIASSVCIVELPGLSEKEDVTDWFVNGGTKKKLLQIVKQAKASSNNAITSNDSMEIIWLSDLFAEPEEKVRWLVEDMLPTGGLSILVSKPKVGKSTLARYLALCVANGKPFLERKVTKGCVFYYSFEEKKAEVRRHFKAMGATGKEKIAVYAGSACDDIMQKMENQIKANKPVFVIVDPMFRLINAKDANDYPGMTKALDPLLNLARRTDTHIMLIHHTTKQNWQDMDSILGSTAIFGSVDTAILMDKVGDRRRIKTSQRYGDNTEKVLDFDKQKRTFSISQWKGEETYIEKEIRTFLNKQKGAVTRETIEKNVKGKTQIKRKVLNGLVDEGSIKRSGEGSKGKPYKYNFSFPSPSPLQFFFLQSSLEQGNKNFAKPSELSKDAAKFPLLVFNGGKLPFGLNDRGF